MTPRMTRSASLVVTALALASVAADCSQCQQLANVRRGNLDRPADVVLVTGADSHTYAVTSNPELGHLRVLDLTEERFVDAPNRFFPLSIPAGLETRRLAVAPDDESRLYALDAASDRVLVVRTVVDDEEPWTVTGDGIATGRAPGAIAAFRNGPDAEVPVELWVTLPDEGAVQVLGTDLEGNDLGELARVNITPDARPVDIVVDPFGDAVVVSDAVNDRVHIFSRAERVIDRALDVGGPTGDLAVGVVDIGDGEAPVVLATRRDAPVVVALRLFRPGFPEDRYAVLGSAEVPALPIVGYVPDQRESAVVCCRELSGDAIDAGEATDAWAAVATADGRVAYLSLAASSGVGGPVVRLIDNDLEPLALDVEGISWRPEPGDEARQPTAVIAVTGDFGDPPFVPLLDVDESFELEWQGNIPALTEVSGFLSASGERFESTANLVARGARPGDIAVFRAGDEPSGCEQAHDAPILAVEPGEITVLQSPEGLTEDDLLCIVQGNGDVRLTVLATDAFTVRDSDGEFRGRLAFEGDEASLPLPGATLSLLASDAGPPQVTGSVLDVPVDGNVDVVDLDLADPVQRVGGAGGFGSAGYVPVGIVGREMVIPAAEVGKTIVARRMVIATGSFEAGGLNVLFACDEAESIPTLCDAFR